MSKNCILAAPDYVMAAGVSVSGGSWLPALPAANLVRREFAHLARSTDTAPASTQCLIDLGQTRDVMVAAIPICNGTLRAKVRVRGYDAAPSRPNLTRASIATYTDCNGYLATAAIDEARYQYDPVTLAPLGALIEAADTNYSTNPRGEGGTPGVIGAGGVLPTGWTVIVPAGVTCQYIGPAIEDGIPAHDLRFFGSSATGSIQLSDWGATAWRIDCDAYDNAFNSANLRLVGGTLNNIAGPVVNLNNYYAGPGTNSSFAYPVTSAPLRTQRMTLSSTGGSGGSSVCFAPQFFPLGAIDFTVRVAVPQLSKTGHGSIILPPVGSPGASSRAADIPPDVAPFADTGWCDLFPPTYPVDALWWGHPSLWDGRPAAEDAGLFPQPFVAVLPEAVIARYWLVEISDPQNPDGYVQMPRVVLAPGWQPSLNLSYGATIGIEDGSQVQESLGGAEFFDHRAKKRVAHFTLTNLPKSEAAAQALALQQRLGISGQMFFVMAPGDAEGLARTSFLARMRTLSPLEMAVHGRMSAPFELLEVVA
jgi:hypothetical protein